MRLMTRLAPLAATALLAGGTLVPSPTRAFADDPLSVFDVPGFGQTDPEERLRTQHRTARRSTATDLRELQRIIEQLDTVADLTGDEDAVREMRALREQTRELLNRSREVFAPFEDEYLARRYQTLVDRIAEQTAELRGLELKHPITSTVLSQSELREIIDGMIDAQLTPERLRGDGLTWIALDMLEPGTDIRLVYANLMEEQVGGLYDDDTGKLYVVDIFDPESYLGGVILSHEITHALQDMHFDISSLPFRTENNDQNLATAAVLEGDATLLMIEWGANNVRPADLLQFNQLMGSQMASLERVPPPLVQSMLFPYIGGLEFLQRLQMMGVENARDYMFHNVPRSTAQILNPERFYPEREEHIEVVLPDWSDGDGGLEEVYRGVTGEWMTRLILTPPDMFSTLSFTNLEMLANEPVAVAAANGWNGDQMVTLASEDDSQWAVVWKTRWLTDDDADEFASAWVRRIGAREAFGNTDASYRPGTVFELTGDGGKTTITKTDGDASLVILATSPEIAESAREWIGW